MANSDRKTRKFSFSEKFARAKADTAGFKQWVRNLLVSFVVAIATFFGQRWLWNWEEAVKGVWFSILVFAATFVLLPAFELVWNYHRTPRRILEDENANLAGELETAKYALSIRPSVETVFSFEDLEAVLYVTNSGSIADVWATPEIAGLAHGKKKDIFARWGHVELVKTRIAKGQKCRLVLAVLEINHRIFGARWKMFYVTDGGVGETGAHFTSILGTTAQAPDIHLYVNVFSDPDSAFPERTRHIVLHSHTAEELRD